MITIGSIASQLGVSVDTLRKWESRHGFPRPLRSAGRTRLFDHEQLAMLREAKRLIDRGNPVGDALQHTFAQRLHTSTKNSQVWPSTIECLPPTNYEQLIIFRTVLRQKRQALKPIQFVEQVASPLADAIGFLWATGELDIGQEHLISAELASVLSPMPQDQTNRVGSPKILLTTPPNEKHTLGLLMAQLVLMELGMRCIYLGAESPLDTVLRLATSAKADIVGLSISNAFKHGHAKTYIKQLRTLLPKTCEIWVGGSGSVATNDVFCCTETADMEQHVERWFDSHNCYEKAST